MCTLTFIPTDDGYLAGMNRDELLTRSAAVPPQILDRDGMKILCPQEPSGGTWIACSNLGNLFALLNWNAIDARSLGEKRKTRGNVIPEMIVESDAPAADARFERMSLDGVFPFRLIGIFPGARILNEWRWDGRRRQKLEFPWGRKHWFSSSLSDAAAEKERGSACESAAAMHATEGSRWLRSLHRSHVPAPGPFSICVHRQDAATVSYTEVECSRSLISMNYLSGNPCLKEVFDELASMDLGKRRAALRPH
jgi:hypothetical protein